MIQKRRRKRTNCTENGRSRTITYGVVLSSHLMAGVGIRTTSYFIFSLVSHSYRLGDLSPVTLLFLSRLIVAPYLPIGHCRLLSICTPDLDCSVDHSSALGKEVAAVHSVPTTFFLMDSNATVLAPRNRIISESTGLYKLQLSPKKPTAPSPTRMSRGLKVSVPIVEQEQDCAPDRNELLRKYASKQAKLIELEKQAELVRFELLELQTQLEIEFNKAKPDRIRSARLTKRVSTIFQSPKREEGRKEAAKEDTRKEAAEEEKENQLALNRADKSSHPTSGKPGLFPPAPLQFNQELRKKASLMFPDQVQLRKKASMMLPTQEEMKKKASMIFPDQKEFKKKASMMFSTKFMADVKDKMDQQQTEIDRLTEKSFGFARNILTSLSPKKDEPQLADSSFMLDNVVDNNMLNNSILLSEDESANGSVLHFEDSVIDIDDYSSSEE